MAVLPVPVPVADSDCRCDARLGLSDRGQCGRPVTVTRGRRGIMVAASKRKLRSGCHGLRLPATGAAEQVARLDASSDHRGGAGCGWCSAAGTAGRDGACDFQDSDPTQTGTGQGNVGTAALNGRQQKVPVAVRQCAQQARPEPESQLT